MKFFAAIFIYCVCASSLCAAQQYNFYNDEDESSRILADNIFVKGFTDKTTARVNEPVVFTFQYFTSVMVLSSPSYQAPDFSGFFTDISEQTSFTTVKSGREFSVIQIKTLLFPQKSGTIIINKGVLKIAGEDYRNRILSIIGIALPTRDITLETDPVTINVLPLPEDVTLNGKFTVSAVTDTNSYRTDVPFNLIVTIKGNGNVKTVPAPDIKISGNLKSYETSLKTTPGKTIAAFNAEREFTTLIMPTAPGEASISIAPIRYFDPETETVRVLKPDDIRFTVTGEAAFPAVGADNARQNTPAAPINNGESAAAYNLVIKIFAKILLFVKENLLWICLCVLVFIIIKIYAAYIKRLKKDTVKVTEKTARLRSKKYFQDAKSSSSAKDFYTAMYKGVLEYFAGVYSESAEGLTAYRIKNMMTDTGYPDELIAEIEDILNECQIALYSNTVMAFDDHAKDFYDKTLKSLDKI